MQLMSTFYFSFIYYLYVLYNEFMVLILNRKKPAFYCNPAKAYDALTEKPEDRELNTLADARENQVETNVNLSDL